jgi:hypothetical protein
MLRHVNLVTTDVSEEPNVSVILRTRIGELRTMLAVTRASVFLRSLRRLLVTANVLSRLPILVVLMMEALSSSETSVVTIAKRRNIPQDGNLHSHRRDLKSYILGIRHFVVLFNIFKSILGRRQKYGKGRFLSDPFQFLDHYSAFHSELRNC